MPNSKKNKAIGGLIALILAVFGSASPSFAAESEDSIDAVLKLNPGLTRTELLTDARSLATKANVTSDEIIAQMLAEAQASAAAAASHSPSSQNQVSPMSGPGGNGRSVKLGNATARGDIYVSPASTSVIEHGHTGIYYSTSQVVEAPGSGALSKSITANDRWVQGGTEKQHVKTTQANRNKAADYAYNKMRSRPYNVNFVNNRVAPAASYNCSQLVWGAYKVAVGIDLDYNGGSGVYPYDIKYSSLTTTYQTVLR
ncbi:MAG: hypothetical protein QM705_03440 [Ancrocorticia sp.]